MYIFFMRSLRLLSIYIVKFHRNEIICVTMSEKISEVVRKNRFLTRVDGKKFIIHGKGKTETMAL